MCKLIDLTTLQKCANSDGGIYKSALVDCCYIEDIIFDANGCILNIVMTDPGMWVIYEFDDDDTAFYNQNGERTNNKHSVNQQAFWKIAGVNKTSIEFANCIKDCCCLIGIHWYNSGVAVVQGIDYDKDTGEWKKSKQNLKATVNVLSDTGANEDRIEVNLNSQGRCFGAATELSCDDVEAL